MGPKLQDNIDPYLPLGLSDRVYPPCLAMPSRFWDENPLDFGIPWGTQMDQTNPDGSFRGMPSSASASVLAMELWLAEVSPKVRRCPEQSERSRFFAAQLGVALATEKNG